MVRKISFKNFKIFRNWQTLELRPITILIGKNNSGKSAIAKLPLLVSGSLKGEPLNWKYKIGNDSNNSVELGSDFKDLVYNRNEAGFIEIKIFNNQNSIDVTFNDKDGILAYELNGKEIDVTNKFEGFLLNGEPIKELTLNLDYIGAIRIKPQSVYSYSNDVYDKIGVEGQNAYPLLIQDLRNSGTLIQNVSEWYEKNFEGWTLGVFESKTTTETKYEIVISNSTLTINIKQTGQGIHQVLPLIVSSFMEESEPVLIIIEEPETHLHPAAHGVLAQRFVDSYLKDKNKCYLVETHSQNFVLRLRRLVAESVLMPKDLAIYYVDFDEEKKESMLRLIEVDEEGEVEWWPDGIFNESLNEVINLRKAQENK